MKKTLTSSQIKLIAIIAMTIDHLTWAFFPGTQHVWYVFGLHIIGRLTAPIMWFFIAEGCHYTHDIKCYIRRLFVFAIISHFAYVFAFGITPHSLFNQTSVMWPLAWSALLIAVCREERVPQWKKILLIAAACVLGFPSDWSTIAVMCPFYLYQHRGDFRKQGRDIILWSAVYAAVYFLFLDKVYGVLQLFTFLTIPVLRRYNGERGKGSKWFFYVYYPAHLAVIGVIRILLHGNVGIIF